MRDLKSKTGVESLRQSVASLQGDIKDLNKLIDRLDLAAYVALERRVALMEIKPRRCDCSICLSGV